MSSFQLGAKVEFSSPLGNSIVWLLTFCLPFHIKTEFVHRFHNCVILTRPLLRLFCCPFLPSATPCWVLTDSTTAGERDQLNQCPLVCSWRSVRKQHGRKPFTVKVSASQGPLQVLCPVWILCWCVRLVLAVNCFPHCSQPQGFSLLILWWRFIAIHTDWDFCLKFKCRRDMLQKRKRII